MQGSHKFNYELMKQLNGDKQMTDVWQLPAIGRWEKSCGKHPTQKPLGVLAMSKARREELENGAVRSDYLERLAKAKIILPPDNFLVSDDSDCYYGVPWI